MVKFFSLTILMQLKLLSSSYLINKLDQLNCQVFEYKFENF